MIRSSGFDVAGVHDKKSLEKKLQQLQNADDTLNVGVMMFDLNNLKKINDTYGHEQGDVFIQTFASYLTRILTEDSFLARFGGDEFVIVQNHATWSQLEQMNIQLQSMLDVYNQTADHPISYAVGYDISCKNHYYLIMDLLQIADQKMYQDKLTTPEHIAQQVQSGWLIGMDTATSQTPAIMAAMAQHIRSTDITGVKVQTLLDGYPFDFYTDPTLAGKMTGYSWFSSSAARKAVNAGYADIIPATSRPASAPSMTTTPCASRSRPWTATATSASRSTALISTPCSIRPSAFISRSTIASPARCAAR